MKNKYFLSKNLAFVFIVFLGASYILFAFIFARDLLNSCLTQLLSLSSFRLNSESLSFLMQREEFYTALIGSFFLEYMFLKTLFAFVKLVTDLVKTRAYIRKFKITKTSRYNILSSKDNEVFTYGLFKPNIYISQNLLNNISEEEKNAILLHEMNHKKSFDPLRQVIVKFIREVMPPFIGKGFIFENYDTLTELAADYNAVDGLGSKKHVVSSLFKLLSVPVNLAGVQGFSSESSRINILVGKKRFGIGKWISSFFATVIFVGICLVFLQTTSTFNSCKDVSICYSPLFAKVNHEQTESAMACESIVIRSSKTPVFSLGLQSRGN